VNSQLLAIYLGGWILTSLVTHAEGKNLRPSDPPLLVSVVAGAVWPLLLLGLAEIGVIVAYANHHRTAPGNRVGRSNTLLVCNDATNSGVR
jgi:hypothetical protein